jgi:hypothetical protein
VHSLLSHQWTELGLFGNWESLGGTLASHPAVAIHGVTIEVFALDATQNSLLWRTYFPLTKKWSVWKHVPFATNFTPSSHLPVTTEANGDLVVMGSNTSSNPPALFQRQLHPNGSWTAWKNLGTLLFNGMDWGQNTAVASSAAGSLDVVVGDQAGGTWYQSFVSGKGSGWKTLGNIFIGQQDPDELSMASVVPGRLDVFAAGLNSNVYHRAFVKGKWSNGLINGWEGLDDTNRFTAAVAIKGTKSSTILEMS